MRTERYAATTRYLPLDEMLDLPRVRVLRVLKHFDWATMRQICDWLNEGTLAAWQSLNAALLRHNNEGHVERAGVPGAFTYRITEAGRAHLAQLLARGEVNEGSR
jgi:hypothetical protein